MLMDFCYYFISSGLLASALFSSYCYYDKENAKQLIFNVSWRGTHAYFVVKSYIDDLLNKTNEATDSDFETDSDDEEDSDAMSQQCYLFFDSKNMNCLTGENYADLEKDISSNNFNPSVIFLRDETDKIKFRRIGEQTDEKIEFKPVDKQFIQVELVVDGKEFDIHCNLKEHYYEGNKILDKDFIIWFLSYYGYIDVALDKIRSGDYILKIIDKNVEMFDLGAKEYVIINESGYERV
tara:strand:+ start:788 stop:1498 length:711 start_codon:yes stop_codon:yes gene_type:complete